MWGHLSSLGQNVAQITKAVGAQILEAAADEQRLDAADFSDGDTAESNAQERPTVLVKKVQRLQDKLSRARDEIDRLNDIRTRATESVSKSLKNKDEEIAELRQLLDEAQSIVSESLSPHSTSPESAPNAEPGSEAHVTTPVIHQKIKASERVSMLTRKFHEEKRTHIAAVHQIKSENAKLKDRVHLLESQLAARETTSAELDQQLSNQTALISELQSQLLKQSESLKAHEMVIARLRSESAQTVQSSARDEIMSLQKTIDEQATTMSQFECTRQDFEATISDLRAELDRMKSERISSNSAQEGTLSSVHEDSSSSAQDQLVQLQSQLESERVALQAALKESDHLRASKSLDDVAALQEQIAQLSAALTFAQNTISELQMAKSESSQSSASDSDYVPRQDLIQLREKARAQLRQYAQKCKALESENIELRSRKTTSPISDREKSLSDETLEKNLSSLQKFVEELRKACGLDESTPELNDLKVAIVNRIQSAQSAASDWQSSKHSELQSDLKELLQLENNDPALIVSKIRALVDEAQSAMAHSTSMTRAYEEAQDSIEALTAAKAQMKKEIDVLMRKFSELQAKCRSAFAEEESLLGKNTELNKQIETLQNRLSEATQQQASTHSSVISRINSLEQENQFLQKEVGNKDAVIRELTSQLESKTKRLVEFESIQATWLEQAQRDRETLVAESACLRQDLITTSADYESRISALQDQIRKDREMAHQIQLDLQASKDLASDYASLQVQLRAKSDECANLSDALDNLQAVLGQFEVERDSKLAEAEARLQASLDAAEEGRLAVQELIQVTRSLKESEATVVQLEAKLGSSRKYALQIESDNAALRHAMQQTMDRIRTFSSDENLVDRRIVNKLLVTYLEKKASSEVLNLMIKMLGFTDEQRRLVLESQRPKGFMSSLSSFIPTPYSAEDDDADDGTPEQEPQQNLADLWVNFLLKETGSGSRRHSTVSAGSHDQGSGSIRSPPSRRRSPFRSPSNSISNVPLKSPGHRQPSPSPKPVSAESPKPVSAESPKPVSAESPKPVSAESPKPVSAESPKPVSAEQKPAASTS